MSISGPPELPGLMAASVCTASITASVSVPAPLSRTGRLRALTIPRVTVLFSRAGPDGHDVLADLHLRGLAEIGNREVARVGLEDREVGLDVAADDLRRHLVPSEKVTRIVAPSGAVAAIEMTWLLVTMYPAPSTTTPEPVPDCSPRATWMETTDGRTASATAAICPTGSSPSSPDCDSVTRDW